MKKVIIYSLILSFSFVLSGCTNKMEIKLNEFIKAGNPESEMELPSITKDPYNGDYIYEICKITDKNCFEFRIALQNDEFDIQTLRYTNSSISKDVAYIINYPDKNLDDDYYRDDNQKAIVIELENDFQEALKRYDLTWDELDDLIIYRMELKNYDL